MQYKPPRDFSCLKSAGKAVEEIFMPWNDYSLKYVGVISNLCESGISAAQITSSLQTLRNSNAASSCEEIYQPSDCRRSSTSRQLMGGGGGGECTWCESTDGDHAECFSTAASKQLDHSYWKCNNN